MFRWNLIHFKLFPFSLTLLLGTTGKIEAPSSSFPSIRKLFILHCKIFWSLPFSRLNSPSSLSLSSNERCSYSSNIFVVLHHTYSSKSLSFLYWEPRLDTVFQMFPQQCWIGRKDHLSHPAGIGMFFGASWILSETPIHLLLILEVPFFPQEKQCTNLFSFM